MTTDPLTQDDPADIAALLVGHRITKIAEHEMLLDDGRRLIFPDTDGGCACDAGCYDLTELNGVDNIITAVELHNDPAGDDLDGEGVYRIFVYADNQKINLATWVGSDGNGYYGTGYAIHVKEANSGRT